MQKRWGESGGITSSSREGGGGISGSGYDGTNEGGGTGDGTSSGDSINNTSSSRGNNSASGGFQSLRQQRRHATGGSRCEARGGNLRAAALRRISPTNYGTSLGS